MMSMAEVIPLSPVPQRDFAYSHSNKHNSLNVQELSTKTRDIQLITNTGARASPTRIPSSLLKQDIPHSFSARLIREEPSNRWYDQHGKCGSLATTDIPGARSTNRHVAKRNKPDFAYSCRDIPGAVTAADPRIRLGNSPKMTDRFINPLTPVYKLPQHRAGPPVTYFAGTQPLSVPRTTNSCADIQGAKPSFRFEGEARTSSFLRNDVATRNIRPRIRDRRSPLDVSDIMEESKHASHAMRTNRMTVPLEPRYNWDQPAGWSEQQHGLWMIGDYQGEKSRPMMSAACCPVRLEGKQIPQKAPVQGASPQLIHSMQLGTTAVPFNSAEQQRSRREVRHSNNIADIESSGADSAKAGLQTMRMIDPLQPDYQWPSVPHGVGSNRYIRTPDESACAAVPEQLATPMAEHPIHSQAELADTLDKVKAVFHSRGAFAGRSMARLVRHFDDGDGQVNKQELQRGLEKFLGKNIDSTELQYFIEYFDQDQSGTISVDEFLHGIRGNLGGRRMRVVDTSFEALDVDHSGFITISNIQANYNVDKHPKVLSGDITRHEALEEFASGWDTDANGKVSKQEFVDYFKDISVGVPDDETFYAVMESIFPYGSRPPSSTSQTGGSRKSTGRKATPYQAPGFGL